MKKIEFLYLSQEEVANLGITMAEVILAVEDVFREHGAKRIENPPKPGVHPRSDAFIHAMPGYLPNLKMVGMKWVSSFTSNYGLDMPAVMGVMILNDVDTGRPLAIMDCRWITAVRTGAASGVAAKYLARKDSAVAGIVGAGTQGRYNLLAISEVLPSLRHVKVYDINPKALEDFEYLLSQHTGLEIEKVISPEAAIQGSDVIVTATGKLDEPVYREKWVKPGALVLPVHHRGWENETLHKVDKFVCDDWQQLQNAHKEVGGFYGPLPALTAELGEIVLGAKPGRETPDERIIDFNYGLAIEDVAMAAIVYRRAMEKGRGVFLPLMEGEIPFRK